MAQQSYLKKTTVNTVFMYLFIHHLQSFGRQTNWATIFGQLGDTTQVRARIYGEVYQNVNYSTRSYQLSTLLERVAVTLLRKLESDKRRHKVSNISNCKL